MVTLSTPDRTIAGSIPVRVILLLFACLKGDSLFGEGWCTELVLHGRHRQHIVLHVGAGGEQG